MSAPTVSPVAVLVGDILIVANALRHAREALPATQWGYAPPSAADLVNAARLVTYAQERTPS